MNRIFLQAIGILLATVAITFLSAQWRWEPASAGNYLVIAEPGVPVTAEGLILRCEPEGSCRGRTRRV